MKSTNEFDIGVTLMLLEEGSLTRKDALSKLDGACRYIQVLERKIRLAASYVECAREVLKEKP